MDVGVGMGRAAGEKEQGYGMGWEQGGQHGRRGTEAQSARQLPTGTTQCQVLGAELNETPSLPSGGLWHNGVEGEPGTETEW